jgi:hypothetical protein
MITLIDDSRDTHSWWHGSVRWNGEQQMIWANTSWKRDFSVQKEERKKEKERGNFQKTQQGWKILLTIAVFRTIFVQRWSHSLLHKMGQWTQKGLNKFHIFHSLPQQKHLSLFKLHTLTSPLTSFPPLVRRRTSHLISPTPPPPPGVVRWQNAMGTRENCAVDGKWMEGRKIVCAIVGVVRRAANARRRASSVRREQQKHNVKVLKCR